MSERARLILDCEELPEASKTMLENTLSGGFVSDMPLVLELLFVSEEEIRALNRRERGVDSVTDVLSFPAAALAAGEPIVSADHADCIEPACGGEEARMYLGSVVICTARAKEQAKEYGHSEAREIGYLTVHGMLHCLGYDHEREDEKKVMREKEERLMRDLGLGRE